MTTQLPLDLPRRTTLGRSDFLVSDSNAIAVGWIDRWPVWPSQALVVYGAAGCGKTHLAHLWRERASAVFVAGPTLSEERVRRLVAAGQHRIVVDDADRVCERTLLHLHNSCVEGRGNILMTARRPPSSWAFVLNDLGSRLRAAVAIGIGPPDDALLGAVLVKYFADRQVRVRPELVLFLVRRIERSFAAAADVVDRLDAASLREGRAISTRLARELLAESRNHFRPPDNDFGVS